MTEGRKVSDIFKDLRELDKEIEKYGFTIDVGSPIKVKGQIGHLEVEFSVGALIGAKKK